MEISVNCKIIGEGGGERKKERTQPKAISYPIP